MRCVLLLVAAVALPGCMTGDTARAVNQAAVDAATAVRSSTDTAINALADELKACKAEEIKAATRTDMESAATNGMVPVETAAEIYAKAIELAKTTNGNIDDMVDRFLSDPNWDILMRSLGLSSAWLDANIRNRALLKGLIEEVRNGN